MMGDGYLSVMHCENADEADYEYHEGDAGPVYCNYEDMEEALNGEEVEPRRPPSCHKCRTTRNEMLCLGCPKMGLRNVWKSLEGTLWVVLWSGGITSIVAFCIYWGARG
jgi:hypothetical protein